MADAALPGGVLMGLDRLSAALGDALYTVVSADVPLPTLTRLGRTLTVAAALPRKDRVSFPYVIVGRRELRGTGFAMRVDGAEGRVWIDLWSDFNGPEEAQDLQGRIRALLLRDPTGAVARALTASGITMFAGSLVCDEEDVFPEDDADMPERRLFHGVQHWTADLEVAS